MTEIMNETLGAAVGTTVGVVVIGYGVLSLVTNSLEALF
jgi:hypothetical protein